MDKKERLTLDINKLNLDKTTEDSRTVRQSLSLGRSKNVTVEVRKKRDKSQKIHTENQLTSDEIDTHIAVIRESLQKKKTEPEQIFQSEKPNVSSNKDLEQHTQKVKDKREFKENKLEENKSRPVEKSKQKFKKIQSQNVSSIDEDEDFGTERIRSYRFKKRKKIKNETAIKSVIREVVIPSSIPIRELANRMAVRVTEVIQLLVKQGIFVTANQSIDGDTAQLICEEFGHKTKRVFADDIEKLIPEVEDAEESLIERPPVVTVMGHVDHGKTSLLDTIRNTHIAKSEAGGITQHIGAYKIITKAGKPIVFIDTPGHAAFSQLRARGANITDIVVLIVAADDGIKEQTIEAINHAKSAKVPIIVAINKIDKPDANPKNVYSELLQHNIVSESFGGDVMVVEISAKTGQNLDKLEEAILLQAEILELKANINRAAEGVVIEASMEKGRGTVATVLIQKGTLRIGDIIIAGIEFGKVKALIDDRGYPLKEVEAGTPVQILGLSGVPSGGDQLSVTTDESIAAQITEHRKNKQKDEKNVASVSRSLENILQNVEDSKKKSLAIIIKGDVNGSVEAIRQSLRDLIDDEFNINFVHSAVGSITESDVLLAKASKAMIFGFNVRANPQARDLAKSEHIEILYHSIIYNVIDDVKKIIRGLFGPVMREKFIGYAEVRQIFTVSKIGTIAGCMVTEGVVQRGSKVRLIRDNVVIHEGQLKTLKRFKDEVKEVRQGYECGMAFENYNDIKVNDIIECSIQEIVE